MSVNLKSVNFIISIPLIFTLNEIGWANVEVEIVGPEEIVFDWSTDNCEIEDIPDMPARAFRDADGNIQLIASHFINRRMIGNNLNSLVRDCSVVMDSDMDPDPAKYNDKEWINSVYTTDGQNIHALVHNEYQGNTHSGMCPSGDYFKCWYNVITYASSADMGESYSHILAPGHLVATSPYVYGPDAGPYGIFSPSNIIHHQSDGYYYSMINLESYGAQEWGAGIMRTKTLNDPSSWRCWDGAGFNVTFINPYTETGYDPTDHVCKPVSKANIEKMHQSLTYNTYLKKFLLVSASGDYDTDRDEVVWGFYFSVSDDLINWSHRKLIMEVPLGWTVGNDSDRYAYPSIIDPDDDSRNFEYTDSDVYLYFTKWHAWTNYDRDLLRIPIRFKHEPEFPWEIFIPAITHEGTK